MPLFFLILCCLQIVDLSRTVADYLCDVARYSNAVKAYQICLNVTSQALGEFHPRNADVLYSLAVVQEKLVIVILIVRVCLCLHVFVYMFVSFLCFFCLSVFFKCPSCLLLLLCLSFVVGTTLSLSFCLFAITPAL